jgi:Family of unknown function (DUF6022)
LGTIVTITFHGHNEFCIPQKLEIIALSQIDKDAVVEALSWRYVDFKKARKLQVEYEEYL